MCGRYSVILDEDMLSGAFKARLNLDFKPHYNASPGQYLPVITNDNPSVVQLFRWGFIPAWAKEENVGYKMINARAEGITEKASFKKAAQSQHCLVLANSFFEWKQNSTGKNGKTPYRIQPTDQQLFAMAGIWNKWTNYETGEEIPTFAIITIEANEFMQLLHERMPVLLPQNNALEWISSGQPQANRLALLQPYASTAMEAYEVTKEVNKTIHDYPQLLEPVSETIRLQARTAS